MWCWPTVELEVVLCSESEYGSDFFVRMLLLGTQDIDWQDAEMKRYVEEQMMMGQGREEEVDGDTRTDYEKRKQELFEVPAHFRVREHTVIVNV